jgi:hypothetical protein
MRESVQGSRLKWFYLKDSSAAKMRLPKFVDALEVVPKKSWKNILTPEKKTVISIDCLIEFFGLKNLTANYDGY